MDDTQAPVATGYLDDDLVYVDPDTKSVVGKVEFFQNGNPKSLMVPGPSASPDKEDDAKPERRRRRKQYPWGTYRSMKRIYKIEGKVFDQKPMLSLDDAIVKAMQEPFWD